MSQTERVSGMEMALRLRTMQTEDVAGLEAIGHRGRGLFRHRLDEQARRISLTIVAYVGEFPVGHAVLTWEGCDFSRQNGLTCPDISDVWVKETWRRRGIGTILVRACEEIAAGQGFTEIGLAVGVENGGAAQLYEQMDFRLVELPEFDESGSWTDDIGVLHEWTETCRYRVKRLPSSQPT